ncbi:MAG: recO [Candidatus Magasanikbacteria bacterium]|nr:recO [Candidatus Magasanikbacteria bacterium]
MTFTDSAIVLERTNFRENDKRLTFYTKGRGRLTAVAVGAKKITSKLSGHLEPFTMVRVMIAAGRRFDKVAQAQSLWRPKNISHERLVLFSAAAELLLRATRDGVSDPALFDEFFLAENALDAAPNLIACREVWEEFAKKVIKRLGYGAVIGDARAAVQKYLEFDLKSLG